MRGFPRSTRGRLTLVGAALLAVALVVADVGLYFGVTLSQRADAQAQLQGDARAVATGLTLIGGQVRYQGGELPAEAPNGDQLDLAVVARSGQIASTPDQPLSAPTLLDLGRPVMRSRHSLMVDLYDIHGVRRRVYAQLLQLDSSADYVLIASQPLAGEDAIGAGALTGLTLLSILILLLGAALVYWLVGRVLSPVSRIAALADTLSEHDLHRRVEVPAPQDELGELVRTFNRMLDRLEASFEALRRFTADASHELRAPLTLMQAEVESSLRHPRSGAEYRRVLDVLETELRSMSGTVSRLLLLARADAGELRPALEPLDVADLLHECESRWAPLAATRDLKVGVEAPDVGKVLGDAALVERILDNLLDNAVHHAPAGSAIQIEGRLQDREWALTVADQGPGVPPSERSRIFGRFAQLDVARTRSEGGGGAGLGLALSRTFAEVQGGRLELVDTSGPGAAFRLWLPAAELSEPDGPLQPGFRWGPQDASYEPGRDPAPRQR